MSTNKPYARRQRYSTSSKVWDPDDKMGAGGNGTGGSAGPTKHTIVFTGAGATRLGVVGSPTRVYMASAIKGIGASLGIRGLGAFTFNVYKATQQSFESGNPTWTPLLASNATIFQGTNVVEGLVSVATLTSGDYVKAEVLTTPAGSQQLSIYVDLEVS